MFYEHYKNKKNYILVDKCMIQENDIWVAAVRYREFNGEIFYVRTEQEFYKKFKIIKAGGEIKYE